MGRKRYTVNIMESKVDTNIISPFQPTHCSSISEDDTLPDLPPQWSDVTSNKRFEEHNATHSRQNKGEESDGDQTTANIRVDTVTQVETCPLRDYDPFTKSTEGPQGTNEVSGLPKNHQ